PRLGRQDLHLHHAPRQHPAADRLPGAGRDHARPGLLSQRGYARTEDPSPAAGDPVLETLKRLFRADRSVGDARPGFRWVVVIGHLGMAAGVEIPALVDAVPVRVIAVADEVEPMLLQR